MKHRFMFIKLMNGNIRDWSLIMGRRGYKTGGGGASKALPLRKWGGGAGQVLAMLKGGGGYNRFWVVLTR